MPLALTDDLASIDWDELSALYRAAPLGDKSAADLKLVFEHSMFRVFVFEDGRPRLGRRARLRLSLRHRRAARPAGARTRQGDRGEARSAVGLAPENHPVCRSWQGALL